MSRGEDIAKLLIETGHEWSARELAEYFHCTHSSIQSAIVSVNRLCALRVTTGTSKAHRPELHYMAIVHQGDGLLAMNRPIGRHKPYVVHAPND